MNFSLQLIPEILVIGTAEISAEQLNLLDSIGVENRERERPWLSSAIDKDKSNGKLIEQITADEKAIDREVIYLE